MVAISYLALLFISSATATLQSSVTLLYQNNLNWTDDANHISVLLLDSMSQTAASQACQSLHETLLPAQAVHDHSADFVNQLSFLAFQNNHPVGQQFWIQGGTISVDASGKVIHFNSAQSAHSALPVLCSQSSTGSTTGTSVATSSNKVTVSSASNSFTGFRNKKSFRFLGIPFANPVVRFQHSSLISKTHTDFDATNFGSQCWQTGTANFSEQCLFLNVFTPFLPSASIAKTTLKPVVVWIHGGAFTSGTGADPTFDGGDLVSRGDVVVVTINYRLSSIGFLALPNTTITGNYGIGDQVTALQWVQQNIAAFGGDKAS